METNNTTTDTFLLEIPKADSSLLKSLVKRMGWTVKATTKPTPYEQALDEDASMSMIPLKNFSLKWESDGIPTLYYTSV